MSERVTAIRLAHCERFPEQLEPGLLYYSEEFRSSIHLCACGCGQRVVLPIKPAGWRMELIDAEVSLFPSIGNREFNCRSHYLIRNGNVIWLNDMSELEVSKSRSHDQNHIGTVYQISAWQRLRNISIWLKSRMR